MKLAWWKIVTLLFLIYSVVAGFLIPLIPGITGVSKSTLSENDNVTVYVHNGNLNGKGSNTPVVWATDLKTTWKAEKVNVVNSQELLCSFSASPYLKNTSLNLVVETNAYRDTLFGAFYHALDTTAPHGVVKIETIQPKQKLIGTFGFPNREILNETIRFLFFHVPFWFAMMLVAAIALYHGVMYLRKGDLMHDLKSEKYIKTTVLMGILGLISGSIWARFTWGSWWTFDVKLNGAALTVLMYVAYLVLRSGITDEIQRARMSAVYSIFSFVMMIVFVMIVPRIYDSLHPGNGGNAPVSQYDFDSTLRLVFYPAVIAWMGVAVWISQLNIRLQNIKNKNDERV